MLPHANLTEKEMLENHAEFLAVAGDAINSLQKLTTLTIEEPNEERRNYLLPALVNARIKILETVGTLADYETYTAIKNKLDELNKRSQNA